ncbi:hypothetical protein [Alicyclobacillus fastidiosus]|uniref:Uncharacterized protein n=1 Tax=Alicyclobacillus fastidiosus TaxID=392011 RepID=A0ABV5AK87_9BACL|nr:hypothetical protein [Alicyclobacillus fastidiosus]WEH09287.1 hypothetical protein PYS47_21865 [Alicyclobacillus fastidiosus]
MSNDKLAILNSIQLFDWDGDGDGLYHAYAEITPELKDKLSNLITDVDSFIEQNRSENDENLIDIQNAAWANAATHLSPAGVWIVKGDNTCAICEENEGAVRIAHLVGWGDDVSVCHDCYADCEPVEDGGTE